MARVTIVIPCVEFEQLTRLCISTCRRLWPEAEIHVLPHVAAPERAADLSGVVVTPTGAVTIAAKRNLASKRSRAEFLAFIDSDAYPMEGWLERGVEYLERDPSLSAVGGPNLAPPIQSRSERYVGNALKSPLVSGPATYRKKRAPARQVKDLPSCNLIVRRQLYEDLGGMNEELFSGEDVEFCIRLTGAGGKILYAPDVAVYHKNRDLRHFFLQRLTYGASVPELLRKTPSFNVLLMLAPLVLLVFFSFSFVLLSLGRLGHVAVLPIVGAYLTILLVEAVRQSDRFIDAAGTLWALFIGNIGPGFGTAAQLLGVLPDRKKLYRNDSASRPCTSID